MLFLAIWNIGLAQDSLGMHHVTTLDYWSGVDDMQMVGNLVYISSDYSGLRIMDLSDPVNPVEIGRSPWSPWNYLENLGVYVNDNRAYLTYYDEGCVLDVSDPTHPTEINHWYLDDSPIIRFIIGDVAVGVDQETRLQPYLMDVSDWNNVQVTSDFPDANSSQPVGMVGDYLCLAGNGVELYDISDPWNPIEVASLDDTISYRWSAKLSGDYVYLATVRDGVHIYDVSDPLDPMLVAACDSGYCYGITITASHLFVIKLNWGIDIWDISDPIHPVFTSTYLLPVDLGGCIVNSGNLLCTALYHSQDQTVAVLDISNPALPVEISRFGKRGFLGRMVFNGTMGYLSDIIAGFHAIDLADPPRATELGRPLGFVQFRDIAVRGDYVYGADSYHGLVTYSVVDPAHPESLSCWSLGGYYPFYVLVEEDYAYATNGGELHVFSLANPAAPVLLGSMEFSGWIMRASNGYLYACSLDQLYIYSLANPATPQLLGSCSLPFIWGGSVRDFAISGDYAYLAYYAGGVQIIDIANPNQPAVVGSVEGSYVLAAAASGNTLVFYRRPSNYHNAMIYVMDLTDPIHPQYVGHYNIMEQMSDMEIFGPYLLTVSPNKFTVHEVDALSAVHTPPEIPYEFNLHPCYPNPFNSTLTIPFTLPIQSEANITIFNILGQKVHQFDFPHLSPGAHHVLWDASSCASGIYIIQLISGGKELNRKALLLR